MKKRKASHRERILLCLLGCILLVYGCASLGVNPDDGIDFQEGCTGYLEIVKRAQLAADEVCRQNVISTANCIAANEGLRLAQLAAVLAGCMADTGVAERIGDPETAEQALIQLLLRKSE